MELGLRNRTAIVTGSSRGIGRAIALGLAKEGANVAICARNEVPLQEAASEIETITRGRVLPIRANLALPREISNLVRTTAKAFGRIDILVNNTGGPPSAMFVELSDKDWKAAVDSLLMSVVRICKEVIPHMRKQKWGRIINMTSIATKQPMERLVLSNAIRAGVLGLTKTLSNELAGKNILVNAICPGWTLTKRVEGLAMSKAKEDGTSQEEVIQKWERNTPLGRMAKPEEIANLVVFLASECSSYVTGMAIQVDGGAIKGVI